MSANIYTITDLLVGTLYRSNSLKEGGLIVSAKDDERAVWYGEDTKSFLVEIQPTTGGKNIWRTLAVKTN